MVKVAFLFFFLTGGKAWVQLRYVYLQPSTFNPQPSTFNLPPSTFNPQPSTFNLQPSTLSGFRAGDSSFWGLFLYVKNVPKWNRIYFLHTKKRSPYTTYHMEPARHTTYIDQNISTKITYNMQNVYIYFF